MRNELFTLFFAVDPVLKESNMYNNPLVTIQILNWNRAEETVRAIRGALNQSYENIEVVVVDNGSTDDSIKIIESLFPEIKLVKLDKNYGCPGGRNRGICYSSGDFIFFCDNDGVLHKDAVSNAMECMLKNDCVAIVTGLVKEFSSEAEIDTSRVLPPVDFYNIHVFQGGNCLHRKSIFYEIGKFPDDYMYGGEENYLSLRVLDAGYSIIKCEQVLLWHKKSTQARNIEKESLQAWGNTLSTAFQLYPFNYFLLYFFYFSVKYPLYAINHGFLSGFLKTFCSYIKRLNKYERTPVRNSTLKYYFKLKKEKLNNSEMIRYV
ncbi:MAG: glycosyltransferase family 2 protein [Desulfuromonadales bacterium]